MPSGKLSRRSVGSTPWYPSPSATRNSAGRWISSSTTRRMTGARSRKKTKEKKEREERILKIAVVLQTFLCYSPQNTMASTKSSPALSRNPRDFVIATMGSHSALQILKGARDEGMRNLVICKKGSERPYQSYGVADEFLFVDDWKDWNPALEKELIKRKAIIIQHGSFISYLGHDGVKEMKPMYYGTKEILEWESNRTMEREWLLKSDLLLPRVFASPEDIDRPVLVKFPGAGGGFGYFVATSPNH